MNPVVKNIFKSSNLREAIREALIAQEIYLIQDIEAIFKAHPEHSDLITVLPLSLFQSSLEHLAPLLTDKILKQLIVDSPLEPTERLIQAICKRFLTDPDFTTLILIELKKRGADFSYLSEEVASSLVFLRGLNASLSGRLLKESLIQVLKIIKKESLRKSLQGLLYDTLSPVDVDLAKELNHEKIKSPLLRVKLLLEQGKILEAKDIFVAGLGENQIDDFSLIPSLELSQKDLNSISSRLLKIGELGKVMALIEQCAFQPSEKIIHSLIEDKGFKVSILRLNSEKIINLIFEYIFEKGREREFLFLASSKNLNLDNLRLLKNFALKEKSISSNYLVEFIESNKDLFNDNEMNLLRERYDISNASKSILTISDDLFLKETALRYTLKNSQRAALVFNDLSITLKSEELLALLKKGNGNISLEAITGRVRLGQIHIEQLPEKLANKIRPNLIIHLIKDNRTKEAVSQISLLNKDASFSLLSAVESLNENIFNKKEIYSSFFEKGEFKQNAFSVALIKSNPSLLLELKDEEILVFVNSHGLSPEAALLLKRNHRFTEELLGSIKFENPESMAQFFENSNQATQRHLLESLLKSNDLSESQKEEFFNKLFIKNKRLAVETFVEIGKGKLSSEIEAELSKDKSLIMLFKNKLESLSSEGLILFSGVLLNLDYSSELAKKVLLHFLRADIAHLDQLPLSVLKSFLIDPNLTSRQKEFIILRLSPEILDKLSITYGPQIELRRLLAFDFWPTSTITKTQLELLSSIDLKADEGLRVTNLLLESLKLSELELEGETLDQLPLPLYQDFLKVLNNLMESLDHVSPNIVQAFVNCERKQKPSLIFQYVIDLELDWSKLSDEDKQKALDYVTDDRFEKYVVKKENGQRTVFLDGKPLLGLDSKNQEIVFEKCLSRKTKFFLQKLLSLPQKLPSKVLGGIDIRTKEFIPNDPDFPISQIKLKVNISDQALNSLKHLPSKTILTNVTALKEIDSSIIYSVDIDQSHVLKFLSNEESLIKEAKKLYESLKKVKKDTRTFLDSLKLISTSEDRKFGVEIELASSIKRATIAKKLGKRARAVDEYSSHMSWPKWTVKFDSSINAKNDDAKVELVSPTLYGPTGLKEVKSVLLKLNSLMASPRVKFDVGESTKTGLHVHHSIEDLIARVGDIEEGSQVALKMGEYIMDIQGALYALCSNWRLSGWHSRPLREANELVYEQGRHGFTVSNYGTLEFRLKEATLNVESIIRWITLTQHVTISLIQRVNNQIKASKKQLEKALDQGYLMILSEKSEESDVISHLAYYQLAQKHALSA